MDSTISTVRWGTAAVVACLLLACALGIITGGVLAQANAPHEPNDNRSSATPIEGKQINGTLSSGNDTDWYSFEATEDEVATFLVTKPISNSTGLYIQTYPPDSNVSQDYFIQSEYDRRDQNSFFPEQSGTYYIKVTATYEGTNESVPYTVRLPDVPFRPSASRTSSGALHEIEPNDHGLTATLIESTQVAGEISVNGDSDWYAINVTEGEKLSLSLVKPANKSELGIELYAPNGSEVANDTAYEGTKKASVTITANQTGTYGVFVASDFSGVNIPYTLYSPARAAPSTSPPMLVNPPSLRSEVEPNDDPSAATPIGRGRVNGTLRPGNETDWYSFFAAKDETVTLLFTKPAVASISGLSVSVYEPDTGRYSFTDIFAGNDTRGQITFTATRSGTHYIMIYNRVRGINSTLSYTVRVLDSPAQPNASTSSEILQETEPNDDATAATSIQKTRIRGEIAVQGDRDYYAINATAGENVSVLLEKPAPKPNLTLVLHAPNGTEIATDTISKEVSRGRVAVTANQSGRYVVEVVAVKASSSDVHYLLYTPAQAAPESPTMTVIETQTPTATPTDTSVVNGAAVPDGTSNNNESGGSGTSGPGFGLAVAVVALLTGGLLAARRSKE